MTLFDNVLCFIVFRKMSSPVTWLLTVVLVALLTRIEIVSGQCNNPLLDGCSCGYAIYERERQYVVNCTDRSFRTTNMLENLPLQTEVLIFTGNYIPELPWNVFGEFNNLSNLSIIDMSRNGIREIKGKSYHHVPNVRRLILNHNNLTISDDERGDHHHHPRVFSNFINLLELHLTNAFADNTDNALASDLRDIFVNSNLSLLNKLHLEQNEIRDFRDRNVFCDLPSLMDLHLGDNYITGLSFNVSCLKHLRFLDLERNNISALSRAELAELDSLSYPYRHREFIIDITGNPLKCISSNVKNIFTWMTKTNVTVRHKETLWCTGARGRPRNMLSFFEGKTVGTSRAITVLLVVLVIVLASLLAALAYISRDSIVMKCKPLIDAVSRKVQYTTIESQDV